MSVLNSFKNKNITYSESNKSAGILDDFAVRKVVNTSEGTIEKAPLVPKDIANKAYVDSVVGGLVDGDYGDITISGTGTVMTVDNSVVTLAKMQNISGASLLYRKSAGSGAIEQQLLTTIKTDLGLTGTNSGDQTITLTGGVTGTGTGTFTTTLSGALVVTSISGSNVILGNISGSNIAISGTMSGANVIATAGLVGDTIVVAKTMSGANLVVTNNLSGAYMTVTSDTDGALSGSALLRNIIFGTGTAPTASNYPTGTVYLKYTA